MRRLIAWVVAVALWGCTSSEETAPPVAVPLGPTEPFPTDHVLDVQVTMAPADWDALRFQPPGLDFLLSETCPPGPRPKPYTWFTSNVTINGHSFGETLVRKKGWYGSMNPIKPSLKVKRADGERIWGLTRVTLNNDNDDKSHLRQCLTYKTFADAGLPASRCAFASVTVNGQHLGVYTHVESIKRSFLEEHFGDDTGDLYESQMSDFRDPQLTMFEVKNSDTDPERAPLYALAESLLTPDDQLLDAVGAHVDLDHFFTHWAMEALTAFWDGYSGNLNNFYVYRQPSDGLFRFIPWGADETFKASWDWADGHTGTFGDMPWVVYANALLPYRMLAHTEGRAKYTTALEDLLANVWDESAVVDWLDAAEAVIAPHVRADRQEGYAKQVDRVRTFVLEHRGRLETELAAGLPDWERGLRMITCAELSRHVTGSFDTPWDTLDENVLFTGTGEMSETVDGVTTEADLVRAVAGPIEDGESIRIQVGLGPLDNDLYGFAEIELPMELYRPGTVQLNAGEGGGVYAFVDVANPDEPQVVGFILTGSITFEDTPTTEGETLRASVDLPVASLIWDTTEPEIPAP